MKCVGTFFIDFYVNGNTTKCYLVRSSRGDDEKKSLTYFSTFCSVFAAACFLLIPFIFVHFLCMCKCCYCLHLLVNSSCICVQLMEICFFKWIIFIFSVFCYFLDWLGWGCYLENIIGCLGVESKCFNTF